MLPGAITSCLGVRVSGQGTPAGHQLLFYPVLISEPQVEEAPSLHSDSHHTHSTLCRWPDGSVDVHKQWIWFGEHLKFLPEASLRLALPEILTQLSQSMSNDLLLYLLTLVCLPHAPLIQWHSILTRLQQIGRCQWTWVASWGMCCTCSYLTGLRRDLKTTVVSHRPPLVVWRPELPTLSCESAWTFPSSQYEKSH